MLEESCCKKSSRTGWNNCLSCDISPSAVKSTADLSYGEKCCWNWRRWWTGKQHILRLQFHQHKVALVILKQAVSHLPGLLTPLQLISQKRVQFLRHSLRDPFCLEHQMIFGPSDSFLRPSSPFRRGRPEPIGLSWPSQKHTTGFNPFPPTHDFLNPHSRTATLDLHKHYQGSSMPSWSLYLSTIPE